MPRSHQCQNDCGEICDCGKTAKDCTGCKACTENVPALSQCDYCTKRATYECPGCKDLFWCADHSDMANDGCDSCRCDECETCRCDECETCPCECETQDGEDIVGGETDNDHLDDDDEEEEDD